MEMYAGFLEHTDPHVGRLLDTLKDLQQTPHQGGTKAFKQLTYKEQALSINGTIATLEKAVRYHAKFGSGQTGRKEQEILLGVAAKALSCGPQPSACKKV